MSDPTAPARPKGAGGFYAVAAMATAVSVNTSWRYFGLRLGITDTIERAAMFAVVEAALVASGWAMRASVRRSGRPGPARMLAWSLCGLSAYMAVDLSGPVLGVARVALGPVLAIVALHLALGIEVRVRAGQRAGTWARILREMRERILSRLGLGDDNRDAAARTRDRAADRAARLATAGRLTPYRRTRLARAVRQSGAALDPGQRDRLVGQIAAYRNLADLYRLDTPSPWQMAADAMRTATPAARRVAPRPPAPVSPAPAGPVELVDAAPESPWSTPLRPDPVDVHRAALAATGSKRDAIRYAYAQLGPVSAGQVQRWLDSYGVTVQRSECGAVARALDLTAATDTGEYPVVSVALPTLPRMNGHRSTDLATVGN